MRAAVRRWWSRLIHFLRPQDAEADLARELGAHLAMLEEEYQERGLSPEEARRAAGIALGGVEQAKELHRAERSFLWLEEARGDARHGLWLLRRNPGSAAAAIVSLAIGIGANTAVFTLASALLFRPPEGVRDPSRLVDIGVAREDGGLNPTSYPTFLDVRGRVETLEGVYAAQMFPQAIGFEVAGDSVPERAFGHFVTLGYFDALGATANRGRLFGPADGEQSNQAPVAVLSERFWTRRFNRDPGAVGRAIRVNGQPFTVVGIASAGFQGTGVVAPDLWLPLNMIPAVNSQSEAILTSRTAGWLVMGARLKPQASPAQAAAEIERIGRDLRREYPDQSGPRELRLLPSSSVPGNRGSLAAFAAFLMALVAMVLLVACTNVAGVLLARAAARRREMAVRLSMGASRSRLVRQMLVETMVLFVLGGGLGVVLARALTSVLVARLPSLPFPISVSLALDGGVALFTTVLSLTAAVVFGLSPALQASRADPTTALKADVSGIPGRMRLRQAFVAAQVGLSVALVVVAGLFSRALERAGAADPGFDASGVEIVSLDLSMAGYTDTSGPRFWRDLLERVRGIPSLREAALARVVPGGFEGIGLGLSPVGSHVEGPADSFEPDGNIVEPGYFKTLRIPLLAGRDFEPADRAGTQPVAIVGEGVARRYWPGETAIGKYLAPPEGKPPLLVVGVARDIKASSLVDGLAESCIYLPLQQQYAAHLTSEMKIVVRTKPGQPATDAIRTLVASMDPNLPIVSSQSLEDSVALGLVPQRVAASVAAGLGRVGLLLAAIGVYAVAAFTVARRTRELGIRIALGAQRHRVLRAVLPQSLVVIALGCVFGLGVGVGTGRVVSAFLFGVPTLDPAVLGEATILALAVGLLASYGPARRATRIDPVAALRSE